MASIKKHTRIQTVSAPLTSYTRFGTRCRSKTSGCCARLPCKHSWIGTATAQPALTTLSSCPIHADQTLCGVGLVRTWAPRLGLEPRTYRLTAGRSTIELSGNKIGPILPHELN